MAVNSNRQPFFCPTVMLMQVVKIPTERVSSLCGKDNSSLEMLMRICKVTIIPDPDGEIEIEGEAVDEFFAKDVVKAIGRGFDPNTALKLLKDNYVLKIINLREFVHSRDSISRIKSRIIGTEGKTKKIIEADAECDLSIYGHTVGIISTLETIDLAVSAVVKLIEGANHSGVYSYLEKARRRLKEDRLKGHYGA